MSRTIWFVIDSLPYRPGGAMSAISATQFRWIDRRYFAWVSYDDTAQSMKLTKSMKWIESVIVLWWHEWIDDIHLEMGKFTRYIIVPLDGCNLDCNCMRFTDRNSLCKFLSTNVERSWLFVHLSNKLSLVCRNWCCSARYCQSTRNLCPWIESVNLYCIFDCVSIIESKRKSTWTYTRRILRDHIVRLFRIVQHMHFREMGQNRYGVIDWLQFGSDVLPSDVNVVHTIWHLCMSWGQVLEWLRSWKINEFQAFSSCNLDRNRFTHDIETY